MRIDLHAHSAISDGTDQPAELIRAAVRAGLDVVALTDHDTTAGWAEAAVEAGEHEITLIPGAEISTRIGTSSVHLLAYLFDPDEPALAAELERIRTDRVPRLQRMVDGMRALGSRVTWDDVLAAAPAAASLGRPHLADALVAVGEAQSREDAFSRLIGAGSPAYVPKYAPGTVDAIGMVQAAGGAAVIAHPWAHGRRGPLLDQDTLARLVAAGLVGLEVDHLDHDEATRAELRAVVRALGIVGTGSSDYHGLGKQGYDLGVCTTSPQSYEAILAASRHGTDPVT